MNNNQNNNNNNHNNPSNNHYNDFAFTLGQVNKIKPKQLLKLDIIHLIRSNNIPELNNVLNDLSQENFAENDYFEFQKNELKLIKTYQLMMQYMMNSINHLESKNQKLCNFIDKQLEYNESAEQVLEKQDKKIKNQNEEIDKLTGNCENMEFLVKTLDLGDRIKELGIKPLNFTMTEDEANKLRFNMVNNINNNNNNNIDNQNH